MFLPKRRVYRERSRSNKGRKWKLTKTTKKPRSSFRRWSSKMECGRGVASNEAREVSRGQIIESLVQVQSLLPRAPKSDMIKLSLQTEVGL